MLDKKKYEFEKKITCLIVFILGFILFFSGCSTGKHCIKMGGNYEGVEGNLEYCFDSSGNYEGVEGNL